MQWNATSKWANQWYAEEQRETKPYELAPIIQITQYLNITSLTTEQVFSHLSRAGFLPLTAQKDMEAARAFSSFKPLSGLGNYISTNIWDDKPFWENPGVSLLWSEHVFQRAKSKQLWIICFFAPYSQANRMHIVVQCPPHPSQSTVFNHSWPTWCKTDLLILLLFKSW